MSELTRPWILGWDVDGTMRGKDERADVALAELHRTMAQAQAAFEPVHFGPVTGRVRASWIGSARKTQPWAPS